jgi:hypothetical protein
MMTFKNLLPPAVTDVKTVEFPHHMSPFLRKVDCQLQTAAPSAVTVEGLQSMSHLTVVPIWEGLSSCTYLERVCVVLQQQQYVDSVDDIHTDVYLLCSNNKRNCSCRSSVMAHIYLFVM